MINGKKTNMNKPKHTHTHTHTHTALRSLSFGIWKSTGIQRYGSASKLRFTTSVSCLNCSYLIANNEEIRNAISRNECCWGTIDSWLLFNWTKGRKRKREKERERKKEKEKEKEKEMRFREMNVV